MLRSIMFVLGMLAALGGTPLRQSEAADDFARSAADLALGQVIEPVDGGVGDDSGVAVVHAAPQAPPSPGDVAPAPAFLPPPALPVALFAFAEAEPRDPWPPPGPSRRCAWLQRFRF